MTARHFTELACWQLSNELKLRIYAVIARPKVARDFKFCDQIRESARSAAANISEGFGKFNPPEFRRYLNIAAGSLTEIQNHLRDALSQQYVEMVEFSELWLLSRRARAATLRLMEYLETCPRKCPGTSRHNPRTGPAEPTGRTGSAEPTGRTNRQNPRTGSAEPTGRTTRKNRSEEP